MNSTRQVEAREHPNKEKYDSLMHEKTRLKNILDRYSDLKGSPNHNAVAMKHKIVTNQIRALFKTK